MPKAETVVGSFAHEVEFSEIVKTKEEDFNSWTSEVCAGVIGYKIVLDKVSRSKVFCIRVFCIHVSKLHSV